MKKLKIFLSTPLIAVLAIFTLFASVLLPHSAAYAEEERPAYRMDISPGQKNLGTVQPGDVKTGSFSIENTGTEEFSISIDFTPYGVVGENYDPVYDQATKYTDITKWIKTDLDHATIKSGEEIDINYTVKVPSDAHGGMQAGTIMVTMENDAAQTETGIDTIRRLGYLVFGNVEGEVERSAKILDNNIPGIILKPDLSVTSLIENTGNVYGVAEYKVQIFPLFSNEEVFTNEEKPVENVIFPETKRFNAVTWEDTPALGIYRVRQTVQLFDAESTEEKYVLIIPLWLLITILAILFLAIFWIVSRVRGRKDRR